MSGINLFDTVGQNYGRLDEIVAVANDNDFSLNSEVTDPLIINDYEGDVKKKDAITLQDLTFNNDYAPVDASVKGLLYFDGFDDWVFFNPGAVLDLNAVYTFKTYFEIGSSVENYMQFNSANPASQDIYVKITVNSSAILYIDNPINIGSGNAYTYDISDYAALISTIAITKNGLDSLASVSINGDTLTPTLVEAGLSDYQSGGRIGRNKHPLNNFGSVILFWDVNNNNINAYDGQPDGNLNSAWVDTIGSSNGSVFGSPTTRDIP